MTATEVFMCDCIACQAAYHHDAHECDNEGHFYVELHAVDYCDNFEGGSTKALVCQECFDSYVASCNKFIHDGMTGLRPPICQGQGCGRYLVRLHNFFDQIQPAKSYLAELEALSEVHSE